MAALVGLIVGPSQTVSAQQFFEEIAVGFEIPRLTNVDMVVQYDGENIFVPVMELFTRLGINIKPNYERQTFSGKYYSDNKNYFIDLRQEEAQCFGFTTRLQSKDYHMGELDLFLRLDLFKKIFDLELQFSFSSLKISLQLDTDFPAYHRLKRESVHQELLNKKEDTRDYHKLAFSRSYFNGAALDWMLSTNPIGSNKVHYMDLTLGSMFLGGDLSLGGTGNSRVGFRSDQISYRWHYFVENNRYFTQVDVGSMSSGGIVSRSLKGVSVTNRPQIRRQYYQTIRLNGPLAEGWEVELYINNQLTDFVIVGADQEYNFDLDIYYGSSRVMLKMYGPNGEIRTEEQYISIPHNLIPKKKFEYSLTTGRAQVDTLQQWFGVTTAHYGVFNKLTLGVSHEMPLGDKLQLGHQFSTNVTYQPLGDLTVSGAFSPGYSRELALTFSRPSLFSASAGYTKYNEASPRNVGNQKRSMRFSISAPFRFGKNVVAARYSISMNQYGLTDVTTMNYGFNSSIWRFHLSYMGNYKISKYSNQTFKDLSSKILFMTSLVRWIRPQFRLDYSHNDNQISSMAVFLSKRIFGSAQMSLSLVRNVATDVNQIMVSLDLYNSFARFSSKLMSSAGQTSMSQIQRGSIRYNNVTGGINFNRDYAVGYGSAVLRPFMDDNYNGLPDDGEEFLPDMRVDIKGLSGRSLKSGERHTYGKLRPYYKYQLQIDPTSLDNPMMRPLYENYEVTFSPNVVTSIDLPLALGSEVSGYIERKTPMGTSGVGGIKLLFYNLATETVIEVTTFVNGDFYFLGLLPGKYLVYPDPSQLELYGYESVPKDIELSITPQEGGGSIEDLKFLLQPKGSGAQPTSGN